MGILSWGDWSWLVPSTESGKSREVAPKDKDDVSLVETQFEELRRQLVGDTAQGAGNKTPGIESYSDRGASATAQTTRETAGAQWRRGQREERDSWRGDGRGTTWRAQRGGSQEAKVFRS